MSCPPPGLPLPLCNNDEHNICMTSRQLLSSWCLRGVKVSSAGEDRIGRCRATEIALHYTDIKLDRFIQWVRRGGILASIAYRQIGNDEINHRRKRWASTSLEWHLSSDANQVQINARLRSATRWRRQHIPASSTNWLLACIVGWSIWIEPIYSLWPK